MTQEYKYSVYELSAFGLNEEFIGELYLSIFPSVTDILKGIAKIHSPYVVNYMHVAKLQYRTGKLPTELKVCVYADDEPTYVLRPSS